MELPDLPPITAYIPLPEVFHSFENDRPFETCIACARDLLQDGTGYLIEKGWAGSEVIFEYAMCHPCRIGMMDELSAGSMRAIAHYFAERVDLAARRKALLKGGKLEIEPWIGTCLLTGRSRDESEAYQLCAQCDGGDLLYTYLPYMICGEAMAEIEALLSKKTRERLDDFVRDHLGSPVAGLDLPVLML